MTAYTITFGKVGDTYPVPPLILYGEMDSDGFQRAVAQHAIPHLRPVLAALGRPELADCYFHHDEGRTSGCFVWIDIANSEGARFCGVEIEEVEGHPIPWDELVPYEQQQGGYWLYPQSCDVHGNGSVWVSVPRPQDEEAP